MRQSENRFKRSLETISRKFDKVLECVVKLDADIIRLRDPEFRIVHQRLTSARFAPFFYNCIGAIDGTHVPVTVPTEKVVQYTRRKGITTQNVLAICDFDMRFTFVVAECPGSVHDMRVFNNVLEKYMGKFPFPPKGMQLPLSLSFVVLDKLCMKLIHKYSCLGKYDHVDSRYPNKPGYLAPYKSTKYHVPEWREGPGPVG
jgi:hypothetical protein